MRSKEQKFGLCAAEKAQSPNGVYELLLGEMIFKNFHIIVI
jgi:hypothetical protein